MQKAEISSATFDILERMAKDHPELAGGYARATAGVDIDLVVAVFANALHDLRRDGGPQMSDAAIDVLAERRRQVEGEGWTVEHDNQHAGREMAGAAAAYCHSAHRPTIYARRPGGAYAIPPGWPVSWSNEWWKPKGPRADLVRAGALILAEIERLDRQAATDV